jgi:hypothetical protein
MRVACRYMCPLYRQCCGELQSSRACPLRVVRAGQPTLRPTTCQSGLRATGRRYDAAQIAEASPACLSLLYAAEHTHAWCAQQPALRKHQVLCQLTPPTVCSRRATPPLSLLVGVYALPRCSLCAGCSVGQESKGEAHPQLLVDVRELLQGVGRLGVHRHQRPVLQRWQAGGRVTRQYRPTTLQDLCCNMNGTARVGGVRTHPTPEKVGW